MATRFPLLATAALGLLLAGCGDDRVVTYRVPKERDPDLPGMAAAGAGQSTNGGGSAAPSLPPGHPAVDGAGAGRPGEAMATMANTAVPTADGAPLSWPAPAGWTPRAAGPMRKGSFTVPGPAGDSDLSITAFPGDVGGELANVNRWRGQIGMTPLAPGELDASVRHLAVGGLDLVYAALLPEGDARVKGILGAMVPFGGGTWFFKLSGPKGSLQANQEAFLAFLRGIKAP